VLLRLLARLPLAAVLLVGLAAFAPQTAHAASPPGAAYVMTNAASGNAILVFNRSANGALSPAGSYSTGGLGLGAGLGSQGALVLSQNQRWLFAVNAGSNEISVFAVAANGLRLIDTVASGGERPISLTTHGDLLYVLHDGGAGNITGFAVSNRGPLSPLAGSTRPLSNGGVGASPDAAQVSFSPNGRSLVVTEKSTNLILTYAIGQDGLASAPTAHPSAGATPFGFAFSNQRTVIVSEAFGGAPDASAASSYNLHGSSLQLVTASAPTHQTAACWVAVTNDGKYAYTTNTGSGSVSSYAVSPAGQLTLLDSQAGLTGAGTSPIDADFNQDGQFLYVVTGGTPQVAFFHAQSDGELTSLGSVALPAGALGLAVR
jgi:6-phosphogluconolactonase (cycloisomerase 2 family)